MRLILCLPVTDEFARGVSPLMVTIPEGKKTRYISISSPAKTYLHFRGVEAYAVHDII